MDWDSRYRSGAHAGDEPLPLLVQLADELRPGRALDVACGPGRHALYLARLGWQVTAVDSSAVAVAMLRRRAGERGLTIDARETDLTAYRIPADTYDLICDFFYLQRDLFPEIRAGLRPGGTLVAALHVEGGAPGSYLLRSGELRAQFADWRILHYSERLPADGHRRAVAEIIARRA